MILRSRSSRGRVQVFRDVYWYKFFHCSVLLRESYSDGYRVLGGRWKVAQHL